MRVMVFFDLPTLTKKDKVNYRNFHNLLVKEGFIMDQFSIYTKLCINSAQCSRVINFLNSNKPPNGNIEVLQISENQYANIIYLLGEEKSDFVNSTERIIEI